ncbi:MAG: septum formation family protein [Actinomycetes bacterium]
MDGTKRWLAVFVVAAAVGAGGVPASAAVRGARPVQHSMAAPRWVRGACGSLSTWVDVTSESDHAGPSVVNRVAGGSLSAKQGRARLLAIYGRAIRQSSTLVAAAKALGVPRVGGGKATAADYRETTRELRAAYAAMVVALRRTSTRGGDAFANRANAVIGRGDDAFRQIGNPMEPITANAALVPVVDATADCQDVEAYFEPSGEPMDVSAGECFDQPAGVVPCSTPHDGEVVFVGAYPGASGTPYPGEAQFQVWVLAQCIPAFATYVGTPYEESPLALAWYDPSPETWAVGDRQVICLVGNPDGSHLTGSVQGSAS